MGRDRSHLARGPAVRASFLVAADGVHSLVARRLGLHTGWPAEVVALDLMEETPSTTLAAVDPSTMWVSYGYGGEGYAYVFPKRQHVNAGVGYLLSYYREALGERGLLRGQSSRADFTPYLIPVGGPAQTTGAERVLLAGDAGGFVNAFTAEGIYYAMVTGELAATALAIVDYLRGARSYRSARARLLLRAVTSFLLPAERTGDQSLANSSIL